MGHQVGKHLVASAIEAQMQYGRLLHVSGQPVLNVLTEP